MNAVMQQLDEAITELDSMDNHLTGYKMQLNVRRLFPEGQHLLTDRYRHPARQR